MKAEIAIQIFGRPLSFEIKLPLQFEEMTVFLLDIIEFCTDFMNAQNISFIT